MQLALYSILHAKKRAILWTFVSGVRCREQYKGRSDTLLKVGAIVSEYHSPGSTWRYTMEAKYMLPAARYGSIAQKGFISTCSIPYNIHSALAQFHNDNHPRHSILKRSRLLVRSTSFQERTLG